MKVRLRQSNQMALKSLKAALLTQNSYMLPLWTISRWNFSDATSRRYESNKSLRYVGLHPTTLRAYKKALASFFSFA